MKNKVDSLVKKVVNLEYSVGSRPVNKEIKRMLVANFILFWFEFEPDDSLNLSDASKQ